MTRSSPSTRNVKTRYSKSVQAALSSSRRKFLQLAGVAGGATLAGQAASAGSTEKESKAPSEAESKPRLKVISTGGTIASTQEASEGATGYDLSQGGNEIIAAVPELQAYAELTVEEVAQKGSPSLLLDDYANVAAAAREAEAQGFDGVLVTHGTDAIEEDAFYNDLVLDLDIPVVFVGAMRAGDAVSADGPANLISATRAAIRPELHLTDESSGVYVVLNEEVHTARDVTKTHTTKVETFDSLIPGPIGVFTDEFRLFRGPGSYSPDLSSQLRTDKVVPIIQTGASADAVGIQRAIAGSYNVDGIVVEATGRGGSSPEIEEAKNEALEAGIPIVTTSRVFSGPVAPSETGDISGGDLPAHKARLLLLLALEKTTDLEELRAIFDEANYGRGGLPPSAISVNEDGSVEVDSEGYIPIPSSD